MTTPNGFHNKQHHIAQQASTSYGARTSPTKMLPPPTDYQTIRDDMSQSPGAVKPTDKRVDYLFKAKQARFEKRQNRQMSIGGGGIRGSQEWAANGNIQGSPRGSSIDMTPSGAARRRLMNNTAVDALRLSSCRNMGDSSSRNSGGMKTTSFYQTQERRSPGGGIGEPRDMTI